MVVTGLGKLGHAVDVRRTGTEGLFLAAGGGYDVLIVDQDLDVLDGSIVVKTLRGAGDKTPVLFLRSPGEIDRKRCLQATALRSCVGG